MAALSGEKILLTGPAGQIAFPLARELAKGNEVWGLARFGNPEDRARVEKVGVRAVSVDLAEPDFSEVPDDFDVVLHLAAAITPQLSDDEAIRINAEGTGHLMKHVRRARACLVMSSTSVYADCDDPKHILKEGDPVGTGVRTDFAPSYRVSKVSQEAVARYAAIEHQLPTVIARMNAAYGDNGGLPAMLLEQILADQPIGCPLNGADLFSPIHEEDILAHVPGLLAAASIPATITNWAGDEAVDIRDVCRYMGELVGKETQFELDEGAYPHTALDATRRRELAGPCKVDWRDGIKRMVAACHPEITLRSV
jgi:nucleoside-diphosphate-sugar epimerase